MYVSVASNGVVIYRGARGFVQLFSDTVLTSRQHSPCRSAAVAFVACDNCLPPPGLHSLATNWQIGKFIGSYVTVTPQKDINIRLPVGGPCFVFWGSFSLFLVLPLFVLVGSVGIVSCTSCLPPPSTSPCA